MRRVLVRSSCRSFGTQLRPSSTSFWASLNAIDYEVLLTNLREARAQADPRPYNLTEKLFTANAIDSKQQRPLLQMAPWHLAVDDMCGEQTLGLFSAYGRDSVALRSTYHPQSVDSAIINGATSKGISCIPPSAGMLTDLRLITPPGALVVGTYPSATTLGAVSALGLRASAIQSAAVMAGLPLESSFPKIVGVHLKGSLPPDASYLDIPSLVSRLVKCPPNTFVEFHGEGVSPLSCESKARIAELVGANVGAEGVVFPYTELTGAYFRGLGYDAIATAADAVAKELLVPDRFCVFDQEVEIDLPTIVDTLGKLAAEEQQLAEECWLEPPLHPLELPGRVGGDWPGEPAPRELPRIGAVIKDTTPVNEDLLFPQYLREDFGVMPLLLKTEGTIRADDINASTSLELGKHGSVTLGTVNNPDCGKSGVSRNLLTGKFATIPEVVEAYKDYHQEWCVFGENDFGGGERNNLAAMYLRHLGCRSVMAKSFDQTFEREMKIAGILPLSFVDKYDYHRVGPHYRISLLNLNGQLFAGRPLHAHVTDYRGKVIEMTFRHNLTEEQVAWFKGGGAANVVAERTGARVLDKAEWEGKRLLGRRHHFDLTSDAINNKWQKVYKYPAKRK